MISRPDMVNVFLKKGNNRVYLIHNIGWGGCDDRWEFIGGKAEGEDLEKRAIQEAKSEADVDIELVEVGGSNILGDYETQTSEGDFLCRTFFAKIIKGEPRIMEKKHDKIREFTYDQLVELKEQGTLVPNLVAALPKIKPYII